MASVVLLSILAMTLTTVYAQIYEDYNFREKPGSCSPALSVDVCMKTCSWDGNCLGIEKCCPTRCGGSFCSRPVTERNPTRIVKPGFCPNPSTGRWICSSTCIDDSDCPETRKCCRTRCGGFICKKPQIAEEPFVPNNGVNPYPNSIPFDNNNNNNNNNFEPWYHANRDNPFLFG